MVHSVDRLIFSIRPFNKVKRFMSEIENQVMSKELILEILEKFISFDTSISPSENIFPSSNCAEFLKSWGAKNGFEVLEVKPVFYQRNSVNELYPVILVKRGVQAGKTVLFLGHLDVVPVSVVEKEKLWRYQPFEMTLHGDKIYGRGSADMQGPIASFMAAFSEFKTVKGNLIIALSGDEEIGGMDTMPAIIQKLKDYNLMPDYVINAEPSSLPIIITKRRGGSWFTLDFPLNPKMMNGEIKEITINSATGGNLSETLHSSYFILGADSHAMITSAKYAVDKIIVSVESSSIKTNSVPFEVKMKYVEYDNAAPKVEYLDGLTKVMTAMASIGSISWPIISSKYGTSVCPNMIKLDHATGTGQLVIDIRAMLRDDDAHEELRQTLQDHFSVNLADVQVNLVAKINPVNVDPNHELPQKLYEICLKHGMRIIDIGEKLGGGSDTRFFTELGIPGAEIGPIHGNAHGPNEYVLLSSLLKLVDIFREVYTTFSRPPLI